ncbi:hypothetical protein WN48_07389 [Eufriesea mexicana]|uniref:Uncharacterized protein n=1 Tax=Eufriesea mexicana TaxID=516756 RepID=A0A310SIR2_9HYME|nr:hypothetical protein WN48_07389 [Eufriesea mexicana]
MAPPGYMCFYVQVGPLLKERKDTSQVRKDKVLSSHVIEGFSMSYSPSSLITVGHQAKTSKLKPRVSANYTRSFFAGLFLFNSSHIRSHDQPTILSPFRRDKRLTHRSRTEYHSKNRMAWPGETKRDPWYQVDNSVLAGGMWAKEDPESASVDGISRDAILNLHPGLRAIELKSEAVAPKPEIVMRIRARYEDDEVKSSRDVIAKCYNRDTFPSSIHFHDSPCSSTADLFREAT